ncbi:hypothetical protein Nhal_2999 [Nitrosococcus halophilus Nc 4]|uniref:Uncharacterized protein n=1 Tax=Nitrosococcus halophilus (strain Nc4) TaxID=472759 RepID=D5BYS0_NITHN|nr:hypothetical protein Nhal_2999 [Nitrosococcus halophilus Nc 4]
MKALVNSGSNRDTQSHSVPEISTCLHFYTADGHASPARAILPLPKGEIPFLDKVYLWT